jgi:hypothetical protein
MSAITDQDADLAAAEAVAADELGTNGAAVAPPEARATELEAPLATALELPGDFRFDEVAAKPAAAGTPTPPLGPLAHFKGTFRGKGFNTIFRPDSPETPTRLPIPAGPSDNILELNLTHETLSFSPSLGSVPNRGSVQKDAFLNAVPYLQTINDVTSGRPTGIHLEPGLWVIVPPTNDPREGSTLVRMASIPHGTTINAQGTFIQHPGAPQIPNADITPFFEGQPGQPVSFPSQQADAPGTPRIPQDLTSFIHDGTINQAILNDPNEVLRNAIHGLDIRDTTKITISTAPAAPLFGGGTDNIAFLWGDKAAVTSPNPSGQNAQAAKMLATFWIEIVQRTLTVEPLRPGQHSVTITPEPTAKGQPVPTFLVRPPRPLHSPTHIKVTYTQIQYTQRVLLNFAGLTWPHVSVATLVPAAHIVVPASAFN